MPKKLRLPRPRIDRLTGKKVWPGLVGSVTLFPHLPQSQQAGAFSTLAREYRGAKLQFGEDGYPEREYRGAKLQFGEDGYPEMVRPEQPAPSADE
ncbi:MAG: hypothetical protein Q7S64_01750 [bacterium]|nr:hypothetical protein [bacterium]